MKGTLSIGLAFLLGVGTTLVLLGFTSPSLFQTLALAAPAAQTTRTSTAPTRTPPPATRTASVPTERAGIVEYAQLSRSGNFEFRLQLPDKDINEQSWDDIADELNITLQLPRTSTTILNWLAADGWKLTQYDSLFANSTQTGEYIEKWIFERSKE